MAASKPSNQKRRNENAHLTGGCYGRDPCHCTRRESRICASQAGYRPKAVYGLWSTVIVAGIGAGKAFIGMSDALLAVFLQAVAGGAALGLVAHAMIPEAIDQAGSLVVPPIVAGFLFALHLALAGS